MALYNKKPFSLRERITIFVRETEKEEFLDFVKAHETTISKLARKILTNWMEDKDNIQDKQLKREAQRIKRRHELLNH